MKVSNQVTGLRTRYPDGVFPAKCPSRVVLDHVTSKWGVLILVALSEGPQRWGELRRRAEGISEKMLAQTLKTQALWRSISPRRLMIHAHRADARARHRSEEAAQPKRPNP